MLLSRHLHMLFNRNNFHKKTFCLFRQAPVPDRTPDHVSRSGSRYWFDESGVYRLSDHWGRAAKCKWRLIAKAESGSRTKCGFALWTDFNADNDQDKLYFIKILDGKADYYHKNSADYAQDFLRTAADTTKRLRQIRQYGKTEGLLDENQDPVLSLLVSSDYPMWQIRSVLESRL